MKLDWVRRTGRSSIYYTADTPAGRVRVSRVNKFGQPFHRAYYPDGKQFTASTIEEAQGAAETYMSKLNPWASK